MITASYIGSYGHKHTVKVLGLVNRGGWWGKTWLLECCPCNTGSLTFVIEADSESDALDEFVDSRFGHLIKISREESDALDEDYRTYAGNCSDPVDLDDVWIERCKVNYFAKQD